MLSERKDPESSSSSSAPSRKASSETSPSPTVSSCDTSTYELATEDNGASFDNSLVSEEAEVDSTCIVSWVGPFPLSFSVLSMVEGGVVGADAAGVGISGTSDSFFVSDSAVEGKGAGIGVEGLGEEASSLTCIEGDGDVLTDSTDSGSLPFNISENEDWGAGILPNGDADFV